MSQPRLLEDVASVLNDLGVVWWLSDGAALGCVREGRFLPTDPDVDIGLWADDELAVRERLDSEGWEKHPKSIDPTYLRYDAKLDLHGHVRSGETVSFVLGRQWAYRFSAYLFDSFDSYEFYGMTVRVPSPADRYLTEHYGADWRSPRGGWQWRTDPPCVVDLGAV